MASGNLLGDFDPKEAIIELDNGTVVVDNAMYLIGFLKQEWKPQNTDGEEPRVEPAELTKNIQFRDNDWIVVYTVTGVTQPVTITYDFTNDEETITFDFFTSGDRIHMKKFIEEARRIVLGNARTNPFGNDPNPDGRQWLEWGIRKSPYENVKKNWYRRTIDIRLNNRFRKVKS